MGSRRSGKSRRADAKARLPVIVITADTSQTIQEDCLAAGADDVVLKPVSMDLLFDSIGRNLTNRGDEGPILA